VNDCTGALLCLRVLRDEPAPAAWNMAVDDALLQRATEPTLRLYGWWPHAVSLGWFQRFAEFADLPPGTPIVRRRTGGGAIHHGDELTFALVLPADLLPRDVAASYVLLHDAIRAALADCGIACERLDAGHAPTPRPITRWCFAEPGRDDLVTARGKLLGSAQRRVQTPSPRVLHHGSLVVSTPALTPFVAAIADARAVDATLRDQLADRLVHHFARVLALEPRPGTLTTDETALARQLQHAVYESDDDRRRR
jgi:lipoate-protein ligase A